MSLPARTFLLDFTVMLILTAGVAPAQPIRVVMQNGDPPPGPVTVIPSCPNDTDNRKVALPQRGIPNASMRENPQNAASCQYQAFLPGYTSTMHRTPRETVIVLTPIYEPGEYTFSATSGLAPEEARKAFEEGVEAAKKENLQEAAKLFTKAVKAYDGYAEAWLQLGKVFRQQDRADAAHRALLNAITADPNYPPPYEDLYQLAFERNDMEDLLQQTETLLSLDPYGFPGAYYYSAVANLRLKHYEAGEERIRAAIENDPDQPLEYFVLGFLLANQGKKAEAHDAFSTFLSLQPEGESADQARAAMGTLE